MSRAVWGLLAGLLFGFGLAYSHMIDPRKVLAFLDIRGAWDPSLAFVMAGALFVAAPLFAFVLRRDRPIADTRFHLPRETRIEPTLLAGAVLFGLGWGLSGYCPGPAVAALVVDWRESILFVASIVGGGFIADLASKTRRAGR